MDVEFSVPGASRALTTVWTTAVAVMPTVVERLASLAPQVERCLWEVFEVALGARRACRQLVLAGCVQGLIIGWQLAQRRRRKASGRHESLTEALGRASTREAWTRIASALDAAEGGAEWCEPGGGGEQVVDAKALRSATQRLRLLAAKSPERDGRVHAAMYAMRGGALLNREAHGLADPRLFERARTRGPRIVEEYLQAAVDAIEVAAEADDATAPIDARLAFFNECRHAHGRTALLLSGGAGLGAYHLGVVAALKESGTLPRVISGASAGSIVAATVCSRTNAELDLVFAHINADDDDDTFNDYHDGGGDVVDDGDPIFRLDFFRWRSSSTASLDTAEAAAAAPRPTSIPEVAPEVDDDDDDDDERLFEAPSPPRQAPGLMCGDHLAEVIRANVGGDLTFQEAFDRTGKILNVPVREHDATGRVGRVKARAPPRLLNYLTAPHVIVWSAARASCAVPGVFAPSPLLVRDRHGGLAAETDAVYVDGSMGADLPFRTMQTLFNCNHFICSQTNVHAAVLGDSALRLVGATAPGVRQPTGAFRAAAQTVDAVHAVLRFVKTQLRTWIREAVALADEVLSRGEATGIAVTRDGSLLWERLVPWQLAAWGLAVMTQPYEGRPQDVTIVPWAGHLSWWASVSKALDNPTKGRTMGEVLDAGKRNTWNELAKIEAHVKVEVALERAVNRLRRALFRHPTGAAPAVGRTPSFYTSPSLLQLSGLAVVDPVIAVDAGRPTVKVPPPRAAGYYPRASSDLGLARNHVNPRHYDDAAVFKTSTMANFYYKPPKSTSQDRFGRRSSKLDDTSLDRPSLQRQSSSLSDADPPSF